MTQWNTSESVVKLEDDNIHIWLSYLNLHEARLKHLYPFLSTEEKERSERFKFFKHRKLFIASHGFMRSVLSLYTDTPAELIEFSTGEQGKPQLIPNNEQPDIKFNLSHSNNLALLAIRKSHEVGVDVEFMKKKLEWEKLSKRFYTEEEQKALFALPEDQQRSAFFNVWTRKEAHMKVTVQGLHLSPTRFTVSVPPEPARFIQHLHEEDNDNWFMQDITLPETFKDYAACLSSATEFTAVTKYVFK